VSKTLTANNLVARRSFIIPAYRYLR